MARQRRHSTRRRRRGRFSGLYRLLSILAVAAAIAVACVVFFRINEVTVAGNFFEVLKNVVAVGSDLKFPGGVGSPSVWVREISVAGK